MLQAPKDHELPRDRLVPPAGYYEVMETALRELLLEKGIFTAEELNREVETMEARSPATGSRIVARAWVDPAYKARLLADGSAAVAELGIAPGPYHLVALENSETLHNLVVCTLCSCYPRFILGVPPAWYKSQEYRRRAVRDPRGVLAEFGLTLPDSVEVRVHDSNADMRYLVIPARPKGTEGWPEEKLAALVTRDCMIGTAVARG
ncbi:MAG: nitrile hydratase subunit alpha [Elsteraceae bacterium]